MPAAGKGHGSAQALYPASQRNLLLTLLHHARVTAHAILGQLDNRASPPFTATPAGRPGALWR
jgi:hypothetical protein